MLCSLLLKKTKKKVQDYRIGDEGTQKRFEYVTYYIAFFQPLFY